jgi:hypothetical protein
LRGEQKIQVRGKVVSRVVEGEPVLVDLESDTTVSIDAVGVEVWRLITRGESVRTIRETILDRFDTDAETVRRDLDQLIAELEKHDMVRVVG